MATAAKLHGYEFWRAIGSPTRVLAPMVDASELAFRMLARQYGAQLTFTPMLHARLSVENADYLDTFFSTAPEDRPLIAQFCGHDPDTVLAAARLVESRVDAVDLNLGCPQGIAKRGRYGAFLLEDTDTVVRIISLLHASLSVPVTAKIRVLPSWEDTLRTVLAIQAAGASVITIHGRTRTNMKNKITGCDWDVIKRIKAHPEVRVPIIANGSIACFEDVQACLRYTGCDAVMASEAVLENPGLFSNQIHLPTGTRHDIFAMARNYVHLADKYKAALGDARGHVVKMVYAAMSQHTDLRDVVTARVPLDHMLSALEEFDRRVPHVPSWMFEWEGEAAGHGSRGGAGEGEGAGASTGSGVAAGVKAATASMTPQQWSALVDTWKRKRLEDVSCGWCKPYYLVSSREPGKWYMRYRKEAYGMGDAPAAVSAPATDDSVISGGGDIAVAPTPPRGSPTITTPSRGEEGGMAPTGDT